MLNVFVGIAGSMPSAVHEAERSDLSCLEDVLLGNLTKLPICHRVSICDTKCFENPLVSSSADFFSV